MRKSKVQNFDYDLPEELIAQEPLPDRDRSRVLVLYRSTGQVEHSHFYRLPEYLQEGDLLVFNDTKVLPARFWGCRKQTGGKVEFLLLREIEDKKWEVLCSPGRKARPGDRFVFEQKNLEATILDQTEQGTRLVQFETGEDFKAMLNQLGQMPLPPYIKKKLEEPDRYQTIYASQNGSAAAPTAGLHFTAQVFHSLEQIGVEKAFLTLHVGLGTFRPVKTEFIEDHNMHREYFELPEHTAEKINQAKERGSRVIAVGTTVCRVLESAGVDRNGLTSCAGETDLFIYPGYHFQVVDAMITNFHLPKSTLLMMICAFAGKENVFSAYRQAIERRYRFFSFGDCMLIL